mmetsp:Transcript_15219/g.38317  ORF Transcript_15219/g.38317 Transcript_15219/m.38317 type:complete len:239 (+) Transcript_15219:141-857(+)
MHFTNSPHGIRNPLNDNGHIHEKQGYRKRESTLGKQFQKFFVVRKYQPKPAVFKENQRYKKKEYAHGHANADLPRLFRPLGIIFSQSDTHVDRCSCRNGYHKNQCNPHDSIGGVENRNLDLAQICRHRTNHGDSPKVRRRRQSGRKVEIRKCFDANPRDFRKLESRPTLFVQLLIKDVYHKHKGQLHVGDCRCDDGTCRKSESLEPGYGPSQNKDQSKNQVCNETHRRGVDFWMHDSL